MTDNPDRPATAGAHLVNRRTVLTGLGATGLLTGLGVFSAGEAAAESSPAPSACRQLITVNTSSSAATVGSLSAWQGAADGSWRRAFGPITAHVGSLGVGRASEGSQITPAGTFPLNVAFGRLSDPGTAMPYFKTDPLDWWDENPTSPNYNLHVRRSSSPGGNSENLYYSGPVYDYAVNINHNPRRVPYAGSGIFLHVTDGGPTAGCVSIDRSALAAILRWLRPDNHPYAAIRVGGPWVPLRVPAAQADNFVRAIFVGVLGRAPSSAELRLRSEQIQNGGSRHYVTYQLSHTNSKYRRVVAQAYRAALGRDPASTKLDDRAAALAAGGTVGSLFVALSGSGEAWSRAGRNPDTWVRQQATGLIGRQVVNPAQWAALVRRSGVAVAARHLVDSSAFGDHQTDLVFRAMLGRVGHLDRAGQVPVHHAVLGAVRRPGGDRRRPAVLESRAALTSRHPRNGVGVQPDASRSRSPVARAAGRITAARTCSSDPMTRTNRRALVRPV